jgi:YidC/Oxa1 family membrane protein insertase
LNTILAPLNTAVSWIITQLFNLFSPVFGVTSGVTWLLTIMILVVIMRLILVPLFIKQMHTQRAMTALTPKLAEIRKKYKGDREAMNQETMKLYQEAGVNPLMGCLPVILQMPIFFALFSVLRYIAEWKPGVKLEWGLTEHLIQSARHAKIFGATIADKVLFTGTPGHGGITVPLHAKIVIVIVVVISMTTTYLTVRQSMKRGMMPTGADTPMGQSQKLMAYIMPLFALTGLYWQFGLVLYWVTTNLWTLGQQFILLRKYPVGAAAMGPGGNLPIGGTAGQPATAAGLTGRQAKPKPSGTGGKPGSSPTPGAGAGKPAQSGKNKAPAKGGAGSQASNAGKGPSLSKGSASTGNKKADAQLPAAEARRQDAATAGATGSANGHKPASNEGGVLRRFGRSRSGPEDAAPAEPQTKIVRQQRQRQSRSKRTGKR